MPQHHRNTVGALRSHLGHAFLLALLAASASAQTAPAITCAQLSKVTSQLSATEVPAANGTPAYCSLTGKVDQRTGVDNLPYAINFRLNLPDNWNGRFYFQGGGGTDGSVPSATGNASPDNQPSRLAQGYAVVATDSGHDNTLDNLASAGGTAAFGTDPQARNDYGYHAIGVVTVLAKGIIEFYYHARPQYSYFDGCSNGGREAMMVTQRYPLAFDGVIAGDPGFNLPRAAVAEAWNVQAIGNAATAKDASGLPLLASAFSATDLSLAASAINTACDALDGLADGMVSNPAACTTATVAPALDAVQCSGVKTNKCLIAAQITALKTVFDGAHNGLGQPLYAGFQWDPGLVGPNSWPAWDIGTQSSQPLNLSLGAAALPLVFTTPPAVTPVDQLPAFMFAYNFDTDAPKIYAIARPQFPQSAMQVIANNNERLDGFHLHGGKLLIYHGDADPVFSPHDTAAWLDTLNQNYEGRAADFVRLFRVPGMGHCNGGPATSAFDGFGTLVNWVEHGQAPETITATAPSGTPWPGRTRTLCSYPSYAVYNGHGDVNLASSFACVRGSRQSEIR